MDRLVQADNDRDRSISNKAGEGGVLTINRLVQADDDSSSISIRNKAGGVVY